MSFANSVSIGPEFFAKAKNDYSDFQWALVREFMQNSMDCGSSRIDVEIIAADGGTKMVVANNGAPMTKEIITGKLLSLGGSGKGFQGTVGGFGKAKEALYFCHKSYEIHSGPLVVQGSGAGYDLLEGEAFAGTRSTIFTDRDLTDRLVSAMKKFASYAQWDGEMFLNGVKLACNLKKGSPRREFAWGTVYTNKSIPNRVIVRVNGIPMFSNYTEFNRTVIIELKGASVEVLTSNRDGLLYKFEDEFDQFLADLVTNKSKALKAKDPTYQHFGGAKFAHRKDEPKNKGGLTKLNARELVGEPVGGKVAAYSGSSQQGGTGGTVLDGSRIGVIPGMVSADEVVERMLGFIDNPVSVIREAFVLKNETTLKIPDYYQPDSDQFGSYGRKLARIWGRLVLELYRLFEVEKEFSIGFVFSDDAVAQYEEGDFGTVYFLNPAEVVSQKNSDSKSFKKRWLLTDRDALLAVAVHEFTHGLGYSSHNEDYAAKLTEVFAKVMKERKRFNWAFN